MRRLEFAMERVEDATRRLSHRDRCWILNACLREALDQWRADQSAHGSQSSSIP